MRSAVNLLCLVLVFVTISCGSKTEHGKVAVARAPVDTASVPTGPYDTPYADSSQNFIYNLLFCDNPELLRSKESAGYSYPFNVLFAEPADPAALQRMIDSPAVESRTKIIAYRRLKALGQPSAKQELLAVIVEVGLDGGLDALASYRDGTARYINQSGSMIIWETPDDPRGKELTKALFAASEGVPAQIGPLHTPRSSHPLNGNARITLIVSGEVYVGQGPTDQFFNDELAKPVVENATQLMLYLMERSREKQAAKKLSQSSPHADANGRTEVATLPAS